MTTGVTCTVLVDGERAADGSPGDDLSGPVVLDDLSIVWGRSDAMSQPEPDACTFEVMDQEGGAGFTTTYRTGRRVDVVAHGQTYPDPTVSTFENPGFEATAVTWGAVGGTATRTTSRFRTGAYALQVTPTTAGSPAGVTLAPGVMQPPGTNPDAWDEIPTTSPGQTWAATLSAWLPPGASCTVRAVLFSGPYAAAGTPAGATRTVVGDGTWQTIAIDLPVQIADRWLGLQVILDPTGPTWDALPPTLAWDGADPTWSWADLGSLYLDDVDVMSPSSGAGRGVLVFSGRITDLSAAWDTSTGSPVVKVTAVGFTADLQNRIVGDEPWGVEDVETRANRIVDLSGLPIDIDIDTSLAPTLLSYRDVDAQGATGLLQQIATSVDGVLWPAVHQSLGAYLRLEDPALRASLLTLHMLDGPAPQVLHTNLAANPDAEAFGAAVTVRTNYCTNPSFEANVTGWTAAGGTPPTLASIVGSAQAGASFMRMTPNAPGVSVAAVTSATIPVTAGEPCALSAYIRGTPGRTTTVRITWGSGAQVYGTNVITSAAWQRSTLLAIVPAGVTTARLDLYVSSTGLLVTDAIEWDAVLFERGVAAALPYFDGATPAAGDFTYAWTGTANASTSAQRAPGAVGVANFNGALAARWSSVVEHDVGARSWACMTLVTTAAVGFIWPITPLLAGQWITATMRVKAPAGYPLTLAARTSGGGSAAPATTFVGTGAWETITVSAQSATDGALIGVQLVNRTPYQVGVPFYVDRLVLVVEAAPYVGPYFDGRTPDTTTRDYAWVGAVDASSSTESTVQTHTIEIVQGDPSIGFDLSACVVLRDPVAWVQDVTDVVTRVSVGWLVQGVDDEGLPTTSAATELVVDPDLEVEYGTRGASVSTQLQADTDARDVGQRVLTRTSPSGWRAEALTVDDDDVAGTVEGIALVLDLLDGTSRIGAPVVLNDLPNWTPAGASVGVYLEGGTYRFVGGRWVLELLVSASGGGLGQSAAWDELDPAWQWDQWSPSITWQDLRGVAAP